MPSTIRIIEGDLLDQKVDVIVNAWNRNIIPWWLLLPQGVSGAIKRRGGYEPFRELAKHGPIPLGGAVHTSAGKLPFKGIIHVAGINMLWFATEKSIRTSVRSALELATEKGYRSIAFPLIGAGTGGASQEKTLRMIQEEIEQSTFDGEAVIVKFKKRAIEAMPSKDYPDNIYGKTIILWACFVVIGQMTCICCILGPLFWLDIMKRADGQPGSFGGIHMTVIGLILLPITVMFAFQLFARQWPMIKIYQEGLQIREIGKPMPVQSLGPLLFIPGFNLVLIILVSFWQLITLQMFHIKTTRLRWEEITNIVQGTGSLEIAGWPIRETREILSTNPHASFSQFCYNQDSFGLPTEKVGEIVQHYRLSLNARQLLRSWDDDFSAYQHFE